VYAEHTGSGSHTKLQKMWIGLFRELNNSGPHFLHLYG